MSAKPRAARSLGGALGLALGLSAAPALALDEAPVEVTRVAAGTRWETPVFVVEGITDGPTVLILGGVHGDEIAGVRSAEEMRCFNIARGRLIIIPQTNVPALAHGTRRAPKTQHADLNRNFPRRAGDLPRGTLARALWGALLELKPDFVVDLHEGYDFHKKNKKSVGSSVLFYPSVSGERHARRIVAAVNATVSERERRFSLLRPPVRGSLARAVTEQLGIPALILETTKNHQPLQVRVDQHLLMTAELLEHLGMLRLKPGSTPVTQADVPLTCSEQRALVAGSPPPAPTESAADGGPTRGQ